MANDNVIIDGIEFPFDWKENAIDWIDRKSNSDCMTKDINGNMYFIQQWPDGELICFVGDEDFKDEPLDNQTIEALKFISSVEGIQEGLDDAKKVLKKYSDTFKKASRLGPDLFRLKEVAQYLYEMTYPEMREPETQSFILEIETDIKNIADKIMQKRSSYDNF